MKAALDKTAPNIDGDGEQTRDFTFVENAVQANIRALFTPDPEANNRVYNVAIGERITVNELYDIIAELTGSEVRPTYRERRAGDIRDSLADISLAKNTWDTNLPSGSAKAFNRHWPGSVKPLDNEFLESADR